jgi:hypothetical protein
MCRVTRSVSTGQAEEEARNNADLSRRSPRAKGLSARRGRQIHTQAGVDGALDTTHSIRQLGKQAASGNPFGTTTSIHFCCPCQHELPALDALQSAQL